MTLCLGTITIPAVRLAIRTLLFLMVPFALPRAALVLLHPTRPNWRWDFPIVYTVYRILGIISLDYIYILYHSFDFLANYFYYEILYVAKRLKSARMVEQFSPYELLRPL